MKPKSQPITKLAEVELYAVRHFKAVFNLARVSVVVTLEEKRWCGWVRDFSFLFNNKTGAITETLGKQPVD